MTEFRLTILEPSLARVFSVPLGVTHIGREPATDLPLLDPQVSRRHAEIANDGQICQLTDLGSANGTFVDEERLTPQAPVTLQNGAVLRFGPVAVRFEIVAAPSTPEPPVEEEAVPATPEAIPADQPDLLLDLPVEPALPPQDAPPAEPPAQDQPAAAKPAKRDQGEAGPPAPPAPPADVLYPPPVPELPGLTGYSQRLINYLPGIYQSDFMARFLAIFESIQMPIEWNVDAFDLFLDPDSSPAAFLDWLGGWYGITFDASWSEQQRRQLIAEAHTIYARRGTRWALARVLEIYTGSQPEIKDTGESLDPFTFDVRLALPNTNANRTLISRLIDAHKPAYTTYRLELAK